MWQPSWCSTGHPRSGRARTPARNEWEELCAHTQGLLVVDDIAIGVASICGCIIVAPVAAIVGHHTLGAVLVIAQVAQLAILHA